ncbi:MAG: hypothetical protein D6679_04020 [Candidatus Hydrogenedentota bacterium]|nr:MAG: hypothetical protein D6679_04020 [Candidatus Hydrogenedentota bacterium]
MLIRFIILEWGSEGREKEPRNTPALQGNARHHGSHEMTRNGQRFRPALRFFYRCFLPPRCLVSVDGKCQLVFLFMCAHTKRSSVLLTTAPPLRNDEGRTRKRNSWRKRSQPVRKNPQWSRERWFSLFLALPLIFSAFAGCARDRNPPKQKRTVSTLVTSKTSSPPLKETPPRPLLIPSPVGLAPESIPKAIWMWHTREITDSPSGLKEFTAFCKRHNVQDVFLQMLYRFENENSPQFKTVLVNIPALRRTLRVLHSAGIRVHALDGYAPFCRKRNHPKVFSQIRAILAYNASVSRDERWDGIHLDNEPHTLPEWNDKAIRPELMRDYYELNKGCVDIIRGSGQQLSYGIDVSFFLDEFDASGKPIAALNLNSVNQPLIYHLLDLVDNAGIMAYRTFSEGKDGTIAHSRGELCHAKLLSQKRRKKLRIWIGLETEKVEHSPALQKKISFAGRTKEEFNAVLVKTARAFRENPAFAGIAVHHYKSYRSLLQELQ